ncbi:hypothetical protein DOZ80_06480 [Pseudomonas fluorescens]|uniref:Uncharacterized protein n=1 Tax=Pseudomonas fluorescens TaxID=294 RepID=A0A327NB41_PSEFL|nr:hypothetical protein [Pseudomonas fluorescens]RAI71479.1 hypothetical protein DOZ80_06480 [Pseudomonas fluorescens]
MKSSQKHSIETKSVGYIKARHNNTELFNSTEVNASFNGDLIVIEGLINFQVVFSLLIEPSTPSGEQVFVPGGKLNRVIYHAATGNHRAVSGTFNANLDNLNEKYRLTFKLLFADPGEIEGELDITGLNA